jgi:YtcA family
MLDRMILQAPLHGRVHQTMTAPLPTAILLMASSSTLVGCSFVGAPSFDLFGAFFPAWMLCGLIGIVGAASARVVLTRPALNDAIPLQLAVCTAVGVIVALLAWMLLFR